MKRWLMPSDKKQVKVTLPSEMVALLQNRYGAVNADTVRQAIADLFAIENDIQHGGARLGAGRPRIYELECQKCGHRWRETLPTLGCPECDSEEFWSDYGNDAE